MKFCAWGMVACHEFRDDVDAWLTLNVYNSSMKSVWLENGEVGISPALGVVCTPDWFILETLCGTMSRA